MNSFEYAIQEPIYITAKGALDTMAAEPFSDAIQKTMDESAADLLILDMVEVDFMNSLGLAAIIRLWKEAQARQKTIRIYTNARIAEIFRISNLTAYIDLQIIDRVPDPAI